MSERYTVIVPASWQGDLEQAVSDVAHSGAHGEAGIEVTEGDIESATAELAFDPFTIAAVLYVGDIVVKAAVGLGVTETLKSLLKRRATHAAPVPERLVVLTPTGEVLEITVGDSESITNALQRILAEAKILETRT
jgi:hypothetical protein